MTMNSTRPCVAMIHGIIAALLVATRALPVCDMLLKHARSQTARVRIGSSEDFGFGVRRTKVDTVGRTGFMASALFSGKNDSSAKGVLGLVTRKSFLFTGIFLLLPPIFLEAYSRFGTFMIPDERTNLENEEDADKTYSSFVPPPKHTEWADVETVTIVFHGAGGQDAYTDELMKNLDAGSSRQQSSYNHIVEWSQYSSNILQASYNGQKVGKLTAKELLEQVANPKSKLTTIHLIGISVGAFAADAAVNEVKKNFKTNSSTPFVQLTLLDPFQQRGIFGVGYGDNEFGKSADYAEQYLNTDDPVPSTNKPLRNTVCYDVTNLRPESIFGHDWPLVYYARSDRCGRLATANEQQEGKIGTVTVL